MITAEHLQELQRFAELGRLSASLLHEISSPLTAALLNLELSNDRSSNIRQARRDMQTLRRYVEATRQQIHRQSKQTVFCIRPELNQLKRILVPLARKANVQLAITAVPDLRLRGDPVKFQHIISNLVVNAIQAYGEHPPAAAGVQLGLATKNGQLVITVKDRAGGIASEALPHIFEAFYTTKGHGGHGLGLGLALIQHYISTDFGGTIAVNTSDAGTCFTVHLPLSGTAP